MSSNSSELDSHTIGENYMTSIRLSGKNLSNSSIFQEEVQQQSWSRWQIFRKYVCCNKGTAKFQTQDDPQGNVFEEPSPRTATPDLEQTQDSEEFIDEDGIMEDLNIKLEQKDDEIQRQKNIIDSLINALEIQTKALKSQERCIKKLASNSRYISVSGCSNVSIDSENIETEKSIKFLRRIIDSLCDKSSALEVISREIKEKIDIMERQQKTGPLEKDSLNQLIKLVERVDEILTQTSSTRRRSSTHEEVFRKNSGTGSSIQGCEENDDLHLWLPGKEFRRLISSHSQQSLAQAGLRASQEELRLSQGELTGIVKDQYEHLQTRTTAIEKKLDMILKNVIVHNAEAEPLEQTYL